MFRYGEWWNDSKCILLIIVIVKYSYNIKCVFIIYNRYIFMLGFFFRKII